MALGEAAKERAAPSSASARFRAFVSYSHEDAAAARRLQRRLETYHVPRRLADRIPPLDISPTGIGPIFRDRADLPASADLSEAVRDALARSQALIVLCSPEAARSPWVAREIALFRALHPDRPVLAALVRGMPSEAFPPEIRKDGAEPLAADFRHAGDGRRLAFLKVVAGILGIPLDELVRRDDQRRRRRVIAVTAAWAAVMLTLTAMTILAVNSRREAERQHAEAEGHVEYMLTDLRQRLKAVGRLDILDAVNRRAMSYYARQGRPDRLSDESLERRARVLGAMGEDAENRGDRELAYSRYLALYETTAALLRADPDNPARVLAHARSENRLALVAITRASLGEGDRTRNFAEAGRRLGETRRLLASIAGWGRARSEWLRLAGYAEGNSCAIMLKQRQDAARATAFCRRAVRHNQRLAALHPEDDSASYDLVFHWSWLAEAHQAAGQTDAARAAQARYLALNDSLIKRDPDNMLWREQQMELYIRQAGLLSAQGEPEAAARYLDEARAISRRLAARDPQNAVWADYARQLSAQERSH